MVSMAQKDDAADCPDAAWVLKDDAGAWKDDAGVSADDAAGGKGVLGGWPVVSEAWTGTASDLGGTDGLQGHLADRLAGWCAHDKPDR